MPVPKIDNFTDRAIRILSLAEKLAQEANLNEVSPSHILVALGRGESGVARMVLDKLDVDLSLLADEIAMPPVCPPRMSRPAVLRFDADATHLLGFAKAEGRSLGLVGYLGTEHILLGIMHLTDHPACEFLIEKGVTIARVRSTLMSVLNSNLAADATTS